MAMGLPVTPLTWKPALARDWERGPDRLALHRGDGDEVGSFGDGDRDGGPDRDRRPPRRVGPDDLPLRHRVAVVVVLDRGEMHRGQRRLGRRERGRARPANAGTGTVGFPVEITRATVWPGSRVPRAGGC